ncbi:DUF72 domain-containing protein [Caminibacter pacificus]|uniref:DUF72 domain-containing protein n=1 Tax=Caminibacter pacificus TaxID=1424653 RepID=A0AAJ4RE18_9BACT|nr:DUF72 domain-containing protein [Caminibacter pacificus]QCI28356.1 DUF72 domain-containing protein [Caminibacter pacificus]ROR40923.1 uncharacterized protein YecE (DUF72 family) [Caminibacter pacificus]
MSIYIGTSGFIYKNWVGEFYPPDLPKSKYFDYYATYFNSLELNSTFYKIPKPTTFKSWKYKIRKLNDFKLSIKANRYITHTKKLLPTQKLNEFVELVKILEDNLGALLFQLPPSLKFDDERLENFCISLDKDIRYAIEFRNKTWYNDKTYEILKRYNVALVWHDFNQDIVFEKTADFEYVRLHGSNSKYSGSYDDEFLNSLAQKLTYAFVYFNNTDDNSAFKDALRLKKLLGEK